MPVRKLTFRAARRCRSNRGYCLSVYQRAAVDTSPTSHNLSSKIILKNKKVVAVKGIE